MGSLAGFSPQGHKESGMTEQLSMHASICLFLLLFPSGVSLLTQSKESDYQLGEMDSIPGLRRYPREGNDNPLQYSCLENLMGRGDWWATVHGITKELDMT